MYMVFEVTKVILTLGLEKFYTFLTIFEAVLESMMGILYIKNYHLPRPGQSHKRISFVI